jgi:hypothetical protein
MRPQRHTTLTKRLVGDLGVDSLLVVDLDWSDLAFLSHELAGSTSKGGVDLQAFNQGGWGDELHLWDFGL